MSELFKKESIYQQVKFRFLINPTNNKYNWFELSNSIRISNQLLILFDEMSSKKGTEDANKW